MKETIRNIQVLYTEVQKDIAETICSYLKEQEEKIRTAREAAVIVVSDEATADPQWQEEIRTLSASVRLIPVGALINVDYNDPEIVPERIEELNFIRIDETMNENIVDSLLLDKDFYEIRNAIQVDRNAWILSDKADAFLISDYLRCRRYIRSVARKLSSENDSRFIAQLSEMKDYLILSRKYARKIFFRKLRNRVSIFLLVSVFLFFVVAAAWLLSNLNRAKTESALITAEVHETDAAEMFILMADGVSNLTIDGVTRGALFNRMNEVVNMNWTTTPTGYNYRHRLYDPHLLGNERYLETLSDNGHALIWDTWTGKIDENFIASQEGVKAYYVDPENNCVIAVAEDNVVYFGDSETDQWMTNGVPFPFSGNTDIHIRSTLGQIIIYDDQNEFFFETEPTIALRSYVTNETMEGKDYRIHSVFLNENGPVTAVESNGSMSMYFRGEDGRLTGYSASVRPDPDCDAAANENYIVFADTEGNILILDRISKEYYTVGLKLPDVRFLSCINDSVFVYHDAMTGTHLYDFRQCIDLGTILTGCEDISYLGSGDHTVFCYADGAYHCQSVSSLLPKSEIDETQVLKRWSGTSPSDGDMLRNVAYGDDGFVHYTLTVYDNGDWIERGYILDGANLRRTGDKVSDIYAKEPETYAYYREPLTWTGDVTVLGVTDEGFCLLIGTDDGQFREISFGYDGGWYEDAYLQIPSHSAVTEILETEDHFLLKDAAGNYWEAGKMYPSHTDGSFALKEMNRKLKMHGYFKKELLDFVDKQTIQDTGIGLMPGGDGKEWE